MKISDILIEAKKKIDTPKNWTTHYLARDNAGRVTSIDCKSAVCFCSIGALELEFFEKDIPRSTWYQCIKALQVSMGSYVPDFNDTHTHQEVMEAWDQAISVQKQVEGQNG